MPSLQKASLIAVLCSDIHLSLTPPIARSMEPFWFDAMRRALRQLKALAESHEVPIICAGDIFHTWKSLPQLVNFALEELPQMYAIPGQHDLPHHNYEDIAKSAYWTLCEAGKITNLLPGKPTLCDKSKEPLFLYGYPWGSDISTSKSDIIKEKGFHLAVVHRYVWNKGHSYPDAPAENHAGKLRQMLRGFGAAVFGDNHIGFLDNSGRPWIFNCGSLMRRNSDQHDYKPRVGLLFNDGTISPYLLNISQDKLILTCRPETPFLDAMPFIELLQETMISDLDFRAAVQQYIDRNKSRVPVPVRKILQSIIESVE